MTILSPTGSNSDYRLARGATTQIYTAVEDEVMRRAIDFAA